MLIKYGDKGTNVTYLQYGLHILCFNTNGIDGHFGNGTLAAVKNFQSKHGLSVDGVVGDGTWNKLKSEISPIQTQLNKKGFNIGTVDGVAGSTTYNQVLAFQRANGLTVDGMVGSSTRAKLFDNGSSNPGYTRLLKVTSPLMYGQDVIAVQTQLNFLGHNAGIVDGYYGNGTKNAVIRFQTSKGLSADGIVGPATWDSLFGTSSGGETLPGSLKKIFIDAGHGGSDSGAAGNNLKEKDITLSISKQLGNILNSQGYAIKYSRTSDTYISLEDRAKEANAWGADLFVSIHTNAFSSSSARGTECYTHPSASGTAKTLSKNVANAISRNLGIPNRGHKEADFAVLRLTNMPAILVETAFISNSNDATLLRTRQDEFASTISNQIINTLGTPPSNLKELLQYSSKNGLFKGADIEIEKLNIKTPVTMLSLNPPITVEAELSMTETLKGPYKFIDLSVGADSLSAGFINDLTNSGVKFDFTRSDLKLSLEGLTATGEISKFLKYDIQVSTGSIKITFETSLRYDSSTTIYQKLIVTLYPSRLPNSSVGVMAPIATNEYNKIPNKDYKLNPTIATVAIGAVLIGTTILSGGSTAAVTWIIALFILPNK